MAVRLQDLQDLVDRINQLRDPQIRFYGSNGVIYVVTKNTGITVGPGLGGNKRETYYFLQGMLAGLGADKLSAAEKQKVYKEHDFLLDAEDHFMSYICYENTVDDPEALREFVDQYGCTPDDMLDWNSEHYIFDNLLRFFDKEDGSKKTFSEQKKLWKLLIKRELEHICSNK